VLSNLPILLFLMAELTSLKSRLPDLRSRQIDS
jgi:hypothetical protein